MARRDDVVALKHFFFSVSAAPQHYYYSMSVIHRKKYILFRSIVFRIKNFYKHVGITPNVLLNNCYPIDAPQAGAVGVQRVACAI